MNRAEEPYTVKEALLFSQRMAQLSKALWKSIEKDWQQWIKPYDLNINEHHILWIAYQLNGASISEIAKFGVMHVSTAFNFSKKLEERGYLEFSKKLNDKRNTYIQLTPKGEDVFLKILESYDPTRNAVLKGAQPLHQLYGKFPEIVEMMSIIRHIYGDDFMEIFEKSFSNIESEFTSEEGKMKKKQEAKEAGESIEMDKPLEPLKN
ncbi:HTH-type transcriptional regulator Hpr [Bacillus paralicheniformis]|jgi:MarR family protease production transcriptional regulator HPr|uniref:HTH-type transcriptional regulator Hpr n=2 Tax=Bacillus paralicheniformis TaxID=1648923 RepID=A0A6I7TS35_9BACI|nr:MULTISPECIES: HTH-type transcriptional regulator Hpr [Bacillus]ETB70768.1 transcriptional regulator [Bacillus sp. CPSM8]KJD52570.1 transcriptional regulator Hpr [Bacillus amyloliquefaciens]KUL14542.1 transcriptional regulator [Bacillus licheniformis LMG 7559]KUL17416.1 transcriptional regulator [Bacillus licheniformis LMG 6934]MBC8623979.1 HTH-type transcriptional regulator Hpr [Robertmurraya crescens]POO83500.1 transcriptional regulator Hpr [Bacillus sp. MBGLi97]